MSSLLMAPMRRTDAPASLATLVLAAGLPVLAAARAVLSPPYLLSSEMTWDLMFNLSGAWHLRYGHMAHVYFHEPVGVLTFLLTEAGFWLIGPTPRAVLGGMTIVAAAIFAMGCFVAWRRLALLPAVLFVVFACLIVLMPANVGDHPNAYSFAMSYNRYGWSGLTVLAMILFQPADQRGAAGDIAEMACAAILLVALFYLKITYFAVAIGLLAIAFAACPQIRARWRGWIVVALAGAALLLLPANRPYLADLVAAADAGIVRDDAAFFFNDFAGHLPEYAPYFAAVGLAAWFWRRGDAPARLPIAMGSLLLASLLLLSQNSQSHGVPLAVVSAFVLHDHLRRRRIAPALLLAILALPVASIVGSTVSLQGYHSRMGEGGLLVVEKTNLRGLAVPSEPEGMLAAFADGKDGYRLLNRARAIRPRYELSPYEYVQTLIEAAALLQDSGLANGRIALLDQVDPLPFMLGLEPPRGGSLWSGAGAPTASAEAYLGDADHVLIPKFTTNIAWTDKARATYGPYLAKHFALHRESRSWSLVSRTDR